MLRACAIAVLLLASCASSQPAATHLSTPPSGQDIIYVSSDLRHAAFFSQELARFGPRLALSADWPSSPARYFETGDRVQCVSVGPPGNTEEFAIKRPIRAGETYTCLTTSFRVTRCFEDCRAAVIERVSQVGGHSRGALTSNMYVDSCRGVLIFGYSIDLTEGIPLHAPLLRGAVGILADPEYPNCSRF